MPGANSCDWKYTKKSVHIFIFRHLIVGVLESYGEVLGNLQKKLVPTPFL